MFNYSSLWENNLITNVRLASNQGRSFLVPLPHELKSHLQLHNITQRLNRVVFVFLLLAYCVKVHHKFHHYSDYYEKQNRQYKITVCKVLHSLFEELIIFGFYFYK